MALMKQLVFESELREPIIRVVMESTVVTPGKAKRTDLLLQTLRKRLGLSSVHIPNRGYTVSPAAAIQKQHGTI